MSLHVRAFPLREPSTQLDAFASELNGPRQHDAATFYRGLGVTHESWHLQETPNGPWVIVVTVVQDVAEAAPRFAAATDEFNSWFKAQVLHLSGVDPNTTPLGPPTSPVFHWSAAAAERAFPG